MTPHQGKTEDSVHDLAAAYALDSVDDLERASFEHHLAECQRCQEEVAELRETIAVIALADETAVPTGLADSVMATVSNTTQVPPAVPTQPVKQRRTYHLAVIAACALAIALVLVGGFAYHQSRTIDNLAASTGMVTSVLTASDAHMVPVEMNDGASSSVVMSKKMGQAVLFADRMSAPPAGMTYQSWMVTPNGDMHSAGTWTPGANGSAAVEIQGDVSQMRGLEITVEPRGGSAQPTTPPVGRVGMA